MKGAWKIESNHIVFQTENELLHPNAEELFAVVNSLPSNFSEEYECEDIHSAFPDVRFSTIGSDIRVDLFSDDRGDIFLELYCYRRNKRVSVDIIQGVIVDQCCTNSEWFYVTGEVPQIEKLFAKCQIKEKGKISLSQYIKLLRDADSLIASTLQNNVSFDSLNKSIDMSGDLPHGLNATLYKYQKKGFFWMMYMLNESGGCILGDEMGLGKTLQVIAVILEYKHQCKTPVLVIAPVSLLQNWKRECEKFAPELRVAIHHGPSRTGRYKELQKNDVVIMSYSAVVTDNSLLTMIHWKLVVLDEAQNIKNPHSDRTIFVKKIPRETCIAVTGTPFENHVTDIWSLMDFVLPESLGSELEYKEYISDDICGADKVEPLLSPIMLRRRVCNVATDLPEKVIIPQPLGMSEIEAIKYEDYRKEIWEQSATGGLELATLQKLRMFCTHPAICREDFKGDIYRSSIKYQRMCEIVNEIVQLKEKVILFTSYQKMFEILEKDIPARFGIPVKKINGSTSVEKRQIIIDEFTEYEGSALLILNPRAAGTGLNITAANHVIHYNLEWNPALEDQASARAYRRGQTKNVFIYRLFYENTIEQIVNERIEKKREMSDVAVVGTEGEQNKKDLIAALVISPTRKGE